MPEGSPTKLPSPSGIHDRQVPRFVTGGAAGDHTVPGIDVGDGLILVMHITTLVAATAADITSEFSITAANTINNTGGTDTTSDLLFVVYYDADLGQTVPYWTPA